LGAERLAQSLHLLGTDLGRSIAPVAARVAGNCCDLGVAQLPIVGRHGRSRWFFCRGHRLRALQDNADNAGRITGLHIGVARQRWKHAWHAFTPAQLAADTLRPSRNWHTQSPIGKLLLMVGNAGLPSIRRISPSRPDPERE